MSKVRGKQSRSVFGAAGLTGLLLMTAPAVGCPLCSEDTEQTQKETGVNVAMGYTVSVLFMITVPVCVVAGLGYFLFRNSKNEAAYLASLKAEQTPSEPTETNES